MRKYLALGVIAAVIAVSLVGCWKKSGAPKVTAQVVEKPVEVNVPASAFAIPYEPADVAAAVAPYTVKPDLSNVVNRKEFDKFTPERKALLAKNAFVAQPTNIQQLFFIYENNDYYNVPSFVTTDSVLQVYHIFYDFTLRNLESQKLYGVLETLTGAMAKDSGTIAKQMTDPEWKKAAEANQVYFAVPQKLLGKQVKLPTAGQQDILAKEVKLVNTAPGRTQSALFPWQPDYSQFIPRGHYTRSDRLKRYFRSMMWYGYMSFPMLDPTGKPAWPQIRQALLITKMLFDTKINGEPAIKTWERIYEPTVFYVGASDDLTPYQYKAVLDKVYGKDATYAQLQDEGKLKQAVKELMKFPPPRINVKLNDKKLGGIPSGLMFKFMGQRYIPDSEVMQRLVSWPERPFPRGLDVMAVLGSERAADILDNVYKDPKVWDKYLPERNKLLKEFNATPLSTWQSNLYWGWLWNLDALLDPLGKGYPSFMTNQAWTDKDLNTALASWAELRHDTLLYAKQSGVECGGGEERVMPKGYVEPNVEFYNRLLWLTKASRTGLKTRGLLSDTIDNRFGQFEDLLTFLKNVSVKELTNQKLTDAEYEQIRYYGADLERLTLSVIDGNASGWYEITNEADKDMALIADVHTSESSCLEEGVGHANEIYVVVPIEGKLYLTRGAIFSYYEFVHPAADRLTDEKWQKMLKDGKNPAPPDWIKSFMPGKGHEKPMPREVYSSGC